VKVEIFTRGERDLELRVVKPDVATGAKSTTSGDHSAIGAASSSEALVLQFIADREGYHQLQARLTDASEEPTRALVKVEYEAPQESGKF